jgi:phage FluMu protein Com
MTIEIKCKHCDRYLGETDKSIELSLKCSNTKCKKLEIYKIMFISDLNRGEKSFSS